MGAVCYGTRSSMSSSPSCSEQIPCGKCVARGCGSICPDGILTSGKGGRMVLTGTEELHNTIESQSSRIRELENALRAGVSDGPHPLLRTDVLHTLSQSRSAASSSSSSAHRPPSSGQSSTSSAINQTPHVREIKAEEEGNVIDAFGTLTIGQNGEASFLGKTARSEYLIRAPAKQERPVPIHFPRLSKRMMEASSLSSPMSSNFYDSHDQDMSSEEDIANLEKDIVKLLPPLSEAFHLCEVYLENGKHMYTAIPRTELFDEILTVVYRTESFATFQSHHALALLFIIFAIATHFDPNTPPYSIEAQEYYHLSRTSLSLSPPVRETTLASIQAVIHMAQFLDFSDWESGGSDSAWMHIGHAVRLGYGVCFYLNGTRWKLRDEVIQRRSRVFWQLFVLDTCSSFCFGRPPGISPSYIDCSLPKEATTELTFHTWNYQYTTLLQSVMATTLGPRQLPYATVLELDKQIRDFPVPAVWRMSTQDEIEIPPQPQHIHIQRWLILASKESTILNLHRAYFAQTLHESPTELQRHRYVPSVLAIYRSAWRLIRGLRMTWASVPHLLTRVNLPWSQALSAAIVLCLLATKSPTSQLAALALEEMDLVVTLFQAASGTCRSAANLLTPLQSLRRKAYEAAGPSRPYYHSSVAPSYNTDSRSSPSFQQLISPAELDRLTGKTHLFAHTTTITTNTSTASMSSSPAHRSRSTSVTLTSDIADHIHQPSSLAEYSTKAGAVHPVLAHDVREFERLSTGRVFSMYDCAADDEMQVEDERGDQFGSRVALPLSLPIPPPPNIRTSTSPSCPSHSSPHKRHPEYSLRRHHPNLEPDPELRARHDSLESQRLPHSSGSSLLLSGGLVLDSTWQSFVEQLGF
ncbi:hypothetical protein K443DRAFT_643750 [Laccaria amethystina LaAM-08-1]|uniref:Xylanolytic transcriptional activator regulatory domain-containing protein n=1 Tax=Laccaria amethystina LaAM-08-1 TaxID=1095629 RepID=A0A0C9X806_9AGAR|nr:hypothetical protein K443DRAFT_643750 [Laccaria amethystina LaAM-08-1]